MKVAIVGAGTVIYQDEGIGVYASKYIEQNYSFDGDVTLVDGGVLGFQLMTYYQDYDKVIIIDTITMDDEVGSIYNIPSDELLGLGSYKQTAHEVEIVEMLEICSLLEKMADVNIIGIIPKNIEDVVVGLTSEMKSSFSNLIDETLHELDRCSIKYKKNESEISLESIIENFANPQSEYKNGIKTDNRV
ncbi:MAG: HyaD/HybD family hydrogenase maturation endopeptidase [Campylobacterota bacterium]|nr:HyaD/HybD family hydrogenase maturation endopeptidase [Campylobacterota bacterium]